MSRTCKFAEAHLHTLTKGRRSWTRLLNDTMAEQWPPGTKTMRTIGSTSASRLQRNADYGSCKPSESSDVSPEL